MRNPITFAILGALCANYDLPAGAPDHTVSVLVYNFAGVPQDVLGSAGQQARAIMRHAGVELQWVNCKEDSAEGDFGETCPEARGPLVFVLHILPTGATRRNTSAAALGFATPDEESGFGFYAGIFYDRVQRLSRAIGISSALAHGIAHELGHLLLGSGHHSAAGIMKADWRKPELQLAAQGSLRFRPAERRIIRANLERRLAAVEAGSSATASKGRDQNANGRVEQ